MGEPRRVVLPRVDFGDISTEHLVEYREENRQQRVLQQRKPCRQILRCAKVPQDAWFYRYDLKQE